MLAGVRVQSVSAGAGHSLVVSEGGALYSFGDGERGQLGHGDTARLCSPKMVDALRHVRIAAAVAVGYHSLALTNDGTVSSWGLHRSGQLGYGYLDESVEGDGPFEPPQTIDTFTGLQVCALAAGGVYRQLRGDRRRRALYVGSRKCWAARARQLRQAVAA